MDETWKNRKVSLRFLAGFAFLGIALRAYMGCVQAGGTYDGFLRGLWLGAAEFVEFASVLYIAALLVIGISGQFDGKSCTWSHIRGEMIFIILLLILTLQIHGPLHS